ncbi:hypothetical protein CCYA_CCYA18G4597 [Cyanidiococcus yangmingshanensis]|nr:hypothetical protein CCYA_CCYA18G4597 [Cyanidiococcus yangmingshanensis]
MRVAYGPARGDLRWRGRLPCIDSGQYEWIGIEWDPGVDAEQHGRHDGTLHGQRYFHCERVPARASFVRADHVQFPQSLGVALDKTYAHGGERSSEPFSVLGVNGATPCVPRRTATLTHTGVAWDPAEQEQLSTRYGSSLRCLDISYGLFEFYEDIAELLQALPELEELDISGNRLRFRNDSTDTALQTAPLVSWTSQSLRILRCNHVGMDLPATTVVYLVRGCVALEELRLHGNRIRLERSLEHPLVFPDALERLYLGANQLRELTHIPASRLRLLDLSENVAFDTIKALDAEASFAPSLHSLNLNDTAFTDLEVLANAKHFPRLRALRLRHLPREHIIARMPCLEKLNGSEISAEERREAELQFLHDWTATTSTASVSKTLLLRVAALRSRYGMEAPMPPNHGTTPSNGHPTHILVEFIWLANHQIPLHLDTASGFHRRSIQLAAQTPWWLVVRIAQGQSRWICGCKGRELPPEDVSVHLGQASENGIQLQPETDWLDTLDTLKSTMDGPVYVLIRPKQCQDPIEAKAIPAHQSQHDPPD